MDIYKGKFKSNSNRLKDFDYRSSNWYYVTICTKDKRKYFGSVEKDKIHLSPIGKIAQQNWYNILEHFNFIELDDFVIMPNHLHGIIILNNDCRDVQLNVSTDNYFSKISPPKGSLSVVVRTFKASVKTWCNKNNYKSFAWQANYFDHIIRNDLDLLRIRNYIRLNPLKWELDKLYIQN